MPSGQQLSTGNRIRSSSEDGHLADIPADDFLDRGLAMKNSTEERGAALFNRTTWTNTTALAVLLSAAGFEHGLFAALQGNKPTDGLFIQAIGDSMQFWKYGGEDALTIIPNFLISGICAMLMSLFTIAWSLLYLKRRHGRTVLLLAFFLLTLVGGGIAVIPFFLVVWAYSTKMDKPLIWWSRRLTGVKRELLSRIWPYALATTVACWCVMIEIAIFGFFPGQTNAETILIINTTFVLLLMVLVNIGFLSAFARDIGSRSADAEASN